MTPLELGRLAGYEPAARELPYRYAFQRTTAILSREVRFNLLTELDILFPPIIGRFKYLWDKNGYK